jgi:hypothetical protein
MHGAHKSRNVANGVNSGKYTNGHYTKEAKEKSSKSLVRLRYLEDIGQQGGFLMAARTRGPKPTVYVKLYMKNKEEFLIALKKINEV